MGGVSFSGTLTRDLLLLPREESKVPLIWCAATVPEEQPLQALAPLKLILETEFVILVELFQQVKELGTRLHDWEGRVTGVVDDDRDAAVGIQPQEPLLLLVVRHDVDQGRRPFGTVCFCEFFEKDLYLLSVGRGHCQEVETLGLFDLLGRVGDVQLVCHVCVGYGG